MDAVLPQELSPLIGRGVSVGSLPSSRGTLRMSPPLSVALPDGGFPQGGVVELAAPGNLGQGVSVALAACAASQEQAHAKRGESAWCAFLDPDRTLHGPSVRASGVCLERLLVARPPRSVLARVALKIALSHVFSVIVVDLDGVPGVPPEPATLGAGLRTPSKVDWSRVARRLSLAVENSITTVFLLTDAHRPRPLGLPVAMRLELETVHFGDLSIRVAKERRGRVRGPRSIAWTRPTSEQRAQAVSVHEEAFVASASPCSVATLRRE